MIEMTQWKPKTLISYVWNLQEGEGVNEKRKSRKKKRGNNIQHGVNHLHFEVLCNITSFFLEYLNLEDLNVCKNWPLTLS
jgi:hypothetical protein